MIKCVSGEKNFETFFTNGSHEGTCDVTAEKGGARRDLGPMNSWKPLWPPV
jgi:hypothetical protein